MSFQSSVEPPVHSGLLAVPLTTPRGASELRRELRKNQQRGVSRRKSMRVWCLRSHMRKVLEEKVVCQMMLAV